MARVPLLQLNDVSLGQGREVLFRDLSLVVQPGDRVALVGRNGCGKSTLMKVMAGLVPPDQGDVTAGASVSVGYMEQDPDFSSFETLGDYARSGLDPSEAYKAEIVAEGLKLNLDTLSAKASGGEQRRAAMVKLLAEAPELMLLDEPTNHLDIQAISWLEEELKQTRAGFVLISHDRAFLTALTRATLWIDRGKVARQEKGFEAFEAWRDKTWAEEDLARHKLDRKIKAEARWAVEGISARRKRNMGRVRALGDLRQTRSDMIKRPETAALALESGPQSGRKVIEARGVTKAFAGKELVKDFTLRVMRGERVALVGPNGVGKTTLLKMLTGEMSPDSGSVNHGTQIALAVFDQTRAQLDPDATLWESLTQDPELGVSGQSDQIMVRGTPRHVAGYLKDFLFPDSALRAPVRSLSGGEKARLLLAKIFARQSNLLVLDEPTNDLDVETLDLLQEVLGDYDGTVLLVSHDRDFLDRVATTTLAFEGNAQIDIYAGGWSDYQAQRQVQEAPVEVASASRKPKERAEASSPKKTGLSFTQSHRLKALPDVIAQLEAEIGKLEGLLSDPELYTREPLKFDKASRALAERQEKLAECEMEWLELAELEESTTRG